MDHSTENTNHELTHNPKQKINLKQIMYLNTKATTFYKKIHEKNHQDLRGRQTSFRMQNAPTIKEKKKTENWTQNFKYLFF